MYKKYLRFLVAVLFVVSGSFLLAGCGGGGSSSSSTTAAVDEAGGTGFTNSTEGTGDALEVAEKVSVVDSKLSETLSKGLLAKSLNIDFNAVSQAASALAADTQYNTDHQTIWVSERSAESFNIINEILCMIAQSKYSDMVNQGAYNAQIDKSKCESTQSDASSNSTSSAQASSSGATAGANIEYENWTVVSTRADADSPHIVRVWMHQKEDLENHDPGMTIEVRTIITEAASADNPLGLFTIYFKGVNPDDTTDEYMTGYLRAKEVNGEVLLQFVSEGDFDFDQDGDSDASYTEAVTLNKDPDSNTGGGTVEMEEFTNGTSDGAKGFNVAFNNEYFYRGDGTNGVCLDRVHYDVTAWRYNLYYDENYSDTTKRGARVHRSSGFPIEYTGSEGNNHGYVGYWGLWDPEGELTNGTPVTKKVYGGTDMNYTAFISGGKLIKHTKKTVELGSLKNVPIEFGMEDDDTGNWIQVRAEWNGTNFLYTGKMDQSTWQLDTTWSEVGEIVDLSSMWSLDFWSQGLGGSGRIELREGDGEGGTVPVTLSSTTPVVFHIENVVYPGDSVPTTLACVNDCPVYAGIANPTTSADDYDDKSRWDSGDTTYEEAARVELPATVRDGDGTYYKAYTFDADAYALKDGDNAVVMDENPSDGWGIQTGPLFAPAEFLNLGCDWDDTLTCTWKAWTELTTYYTWRTGEDEWQRFSGLKDGSNNFVTFDPPLSVKYTHAQTDSTKFDYKFNGSKFVLEYGGAGDLWGIPGHCVDWDTGAETDCFADGDTDFPRWINDFSIADGSVVTATDPATDTEVSMYVKAVEKEERMRPVSETACADLTLTTYDVPDMADWIDPDIGTEPTVDDAPAVIGGVLQ